MTLSDKRTQINLVYHYEDGSWWADSPDLPGLFAGGDSLDEAKKLAHQVVEDELGDDVLLVEWMPMPDTMRSMLMTGTRGQESDEGRIRMWTSKDRSPRFHIDVKLESSS